MPRCTRLISPQDLIRSKVTCVDAPTGSGKTYLLVEYMRTFCKSKVMVVISWTSLCNYYKSMLEDTTDLHWELYTESTVNKWNPIDNLHVIVCYPSLKGLDERMLHEQ